MSAPLHSNPLTREPAQAAAPWPGAPAAAARGAAWDEPFPHASFHRFRRVLADLHPGQPADAELRRLYQQTREDAETKTALLRGMARAILLARARFHDLVELRRVNAELKAALAHVKRLQGLLPICMYCHKIRTDRASWERLEVYLSEHTDATFTHGICPGCFHQHFPEL